METSELDFKIAYPTSDQEVMRAKLLGKWSTATDSELKDLMFSHAGQTWLNLFFLQTLGEKGLLNDEQKALVAEMIEKIEIFNT